MIRGCEWEAIKLTVQPRSPFSVFFLDDNIRSCDILSSILNDKWFGIISVDLHTPDVLKERYRKINFGTIFEKLAVDEDMLSKTQKLHCHKSGLKFPLDPQLVGFIK